MTTLLIYSTTSPELAYERLRDFCVFDVRAFWKNEDIKQLNENKITAIVHNKPKLPANTNFPTNCCVEFTYYGDERQDYKPQLELLLFNLEQPRIFNLFGEEKKIEEV